MDANYYFEKAKIPKAVMHFSLPMILGMSVSIIYTLLNTFFIGLLHDSVMMSAITLTLPVFVMLMALGNLIGVGGGTFISRLFGEKKLHKMKEVSSFSFYISIALGILSIIIGILFINGITSGLGASSEAFYYTKQYVFVLIVGAPIVILNFSLEQIVRSEGAAVVSMIGMFVSVILNVILDPIFLFIFDWGVPGVAIATLIGNLGAVLYYCWYIIRKSEVLSFSWKFFTLEKSIAIEVFKIGIPVALMSALMGVTALVFMNYAALYGDHAVASYGISQRILQLPELIIMGLCEGIVPLIAYNFTSNKKRMNAVIKFSSIVVGSLATLFAIIVFFAGNHVIGIFTIDPAIIDQGSYIVKVIFISLFITGFTTLIIGIFQATGQGKAALIMSFSQGLAMIPVLIIANHYFSFHGVIWSIVIGDLITFIIGVTVLFALRNKLVIAEDFDFED